jgi:hypothetical protein
MDGRYPSPVAARAAILVALRASGLQLTEEPTRLYVRS